MEGLQVEIVGVGRDKRLSMRKSHFSVKMCDSEVNIFVELCEFIAAKRRIFHFLSSFWTGYKQYLYSKLEEKPVFLCDVRSPVSGTGH